MSKRFIMVARDPSIEPLGLHYLAEIPKQAGFESRVVLVKDENFEKFFEVLNEKKEDTIVGIHIWAGYHTPLLSLARNLKEQGIPVVMGGPYATYSPDRCAPYADWVIRGSGYGFLKKVLEGNLPKGTHFDEKARYEDWPVPERDVIYDHYPQFANSPIKSSLASEGCPYKCTYCHAPEREEMHGGFENVRRDVGLLIKEAHIILKRWPLKLIYFQDDIFGFGLDDWLPEFSKRWKEEVGVPFHCQLRLEMVRGGDGDRRLDLLRAAGCTGITLAIESDSEFIRTHVLQRPMPDQMILDGCKKIMDRGMTLRTEQILMVPFSDINTDLGTLRLNVRIRPTMAWTSILSPYPGVPVGEFAKKFNLWQGDFDDLKDSFLDRSVMKHIAGGPRDIEKAILSLPPKLRRQALHLMRAVMRDEQTAEVFYTHNSRDKFGVKEKVGEVFYLTETENEKYREQGVRLQRFFNTFALIPDGHELAKLIVELPDSEWNWEEVGRLTRDHLLKHFSQNKLDIFEMSLANEMDLPSPNLFPPIIKKNPFFFIFFPAGGELAWKIVRNGIFSDGEPMPVSVDRYGREARHHLFDYGLYKVKIGPEAIAS